MADQHSLPDKELPQKADSDASSDFNDDDFEKLSMPCSDTSSNDVEVLADSSDRGDTCDFAAGLTDVEIKKPPTVSKDLSPVSESRMCSEVDYMSQEHSDYHSFARTSTFSRTPEVSNHETRSLSSQLRQIASIAEQQMEADIEAEVMRRMESERARWERERAALVNRNEVLETQLRRQTSRNNIAAQQTRCPNCERLQCQIDVLLQEARINNAQKQEFEDEVHQLRAQLSATMVSAHKNQVQASPPLAGIPSNSPRVEIPSSSPRVGIPSSSRRVEIPPTTDVRVPEPGSAVSTLPPPCFVERSSVDRPAVPVKWRCQWCEYDNRPSANVCEMCENLKGSRPSWSH